MQKNHIFDGHFFQESLKSVKIDCIRIPHGILRGKVVYLVIERSTMMKIASFFEKNAKKSYF